MWGIKVAQMIKTCDKELHGACHFITAYLAFKNHTILHTKTKQKKKRKRNH